MSKIYSVEEAHRIVDPGVRTVTALMGKGTGNEKIAAIIVEYEPGVEPGGIHYHEGRESAYIVLEGSATIMLNGEEHEIKAGTVVNITPGDAHGFVRIGTDGFRMIEVYAPLDPDMIYVDE
ncbi:cupin domain-containing protein [Candidatus Bathyarchaeota archaeon]|nr:cupin domain-containing protein [Candidatus Bathyarchaeota archaeon]